MPTPRRIPLDPATPLRSLRVALGLTQEEAAERLNVHRAAGGKAPLRHPRSTWSEAERRGRAVGVETLDECFAALGRAPVGLVDEGPLPVPDGSKEKSERRA